MFLLFPDNQYINKHVESLRRMCLDQGSIPCSSTLSAVALAKADFFIPAKADFLSAEGGLSFPPKANYLSAEGELSLRRRRIISPPKANYLSAESGFSFTSGSLILIFTCLR
jgi:hypothetical protein